MNKKGFTLVELLVVVAIIAVLLLGVVPNVLELFDKNSVELMKIEEKNIAQAAEAFDKDYCTRPLNNEYKSECNTYKKTVDVNKYVCVSDLQTLGYYEADVDYNEVACKGIVLFENYTRKTYLICEDEYRTTEENSYDSLIEGC